jgi:hypothetical protein
MQPRQDDRWTARTILEHIQEANADPANRFAFSGLCCMLDDDSTDSGRSPKRNSVDLEETGASRIESQFKPSELAEDLVEMGDAPTHLNPSQTVKHPKSSLGQQQLPGDFLPQNPLETIASEEAPAPASESKLLPFARPPDISEHIEGERLKTTVISRTSLPEEVPVMRAGTIEPEKAPPVVDPRGSQMESEVPISLLGPGTAVLLPEAAFRPSSKSNQEGNSRVDPTEQVSTSAHEGRFSSAGDMSLSVKPLKIRRSIPTAGSPAINTSASFAPPGFYLPRPRDDAMIEQQFIELMHKRGWQNLPEQNKRNMLAYQLAKKWALIHQDKLSEWQAEQHRKMSARETTGGTEGQAAALRKKRFPDKKRFWGLKLF